MQQNKISGFCNVKKYNYDNYDRKAFSNSIVYW